MGRERLLGPDRFEALYEIARRDDVHAQFADRFDRPRIHAGDIRNVVAWRVLHRHALHPFQQIAQPTDEAIPSGVGLLLAREAIEVVALDCMDETPRLAACRNEVVPAPGRHLLRRGQARQPRRDRIRSLEVVEQPSVESILDERALHVRDRKRHVTSIQPGPLEPGRRRPS
jgi:hypothetical protein